MKQSFLRKVLPIAAVGALIGLTGCVSITNSLEFANGQVVPNVIMDATTDYLSMNTDVDLKIDGRELSALSDDELKEVCTLMRGEVDESTPLTVETGGVSDEGTLNCKFLGEPSALDSVATEGFNTTYDDSKKVYTIDVDLSTFAGEGTDGMELSQLKEVGVSLVTILSFPASIESVTVDGKDVTESAPAKGITSTEKTVSINHLEVEGGMLKVVGAETDGKTIFGIPLLLGIGIIVGIVLLGGVVVFFLDYKKKERKNLEKAKSKNVSARGATTVTPESNPVVVKEADPVVTETNPTVYEEEGLPVDDIATQTFFSGEGTDQGQVDPTQPVVDGTVQDTPDNDLER